MKDKNGNPIPDVAVPETGDDEEKTLPTEGSEDEDTGSSTQTQDNKENTSTQSEKKKKGGEWINQLPKNQRPLIDAEKYPTVGDFVSEMLGGKDKEAENSDSTTGETVEEDDWSIFDGIDDSDDEDAFITKGVIDSLKEKGVKAKQVQSLLIAMGEVNKERQQGYVERVQKKCAKELKRRWGDDYDVRSDALTRGMVHVYGDDKAQKEAIKNGVLLDPVKCHLLSEIGMLKGEAVPPNSKANTKSVEEDPDDPFGCEW